MYAVLLAEKGLQPCPEAAKDPGFTLDSGISAFMTRDYVDLEAKLPTRNADKSGLCFF